MLEEKFDDFLAELMQNPKFKEEYDALTPEFDAISAEMDAQTGSSAGMLAKYANPELTPLEKTAWAEAAEKKYGT